ncbi:hypothetical protein E2C01_021902 [Portunus trituberculatus]|uniref:Uncharacterized protein n=1 Tax=Portunus trituberculatus TaxID=210409 RepID=A0A5B7E3T7_PORTR|nr:hypothetical protein [Portunus trituberculatus]
MGRGKARQGRVRRAGGLACFVEIGGGVRMEEVVVMVEVVMGINPEELVIHAVSRCPGLNNYTRFVTQKPLLASRLVLKVSLAQKGKKVEREIRKRLCV